MNNGNSPYSTGVNDKNIKFKQGPQDSQMAKYKQDEHNQRPNKILPHELESITQLLGNTFVSLTDIRNTLDRAQQTKEIDQHVIDNIKNKIDEINKIVLEIPDDLAKIGI